MNTPPLALNLPENDGAVPFTTAIMHECAQRLAREFGQQFRAILSRPTAEQTLAAIFDLCKRAYEFAPDPPEAELVRNHVAQVRQMLAGKTVRGDCDDLAVVIAAMLIALDFPYAFVTVSRDSGPYEHILTVAGTKERGWYPIDPQEAPAAGQWPASIFRAATWLPGGVQA
jgi:transglutaminase-like putative cysteine protease